MAKTQIKNYVFKPGIGNNDNVFPDAYSLLSSNKTFIQKEATAWIADQVYAGASGFVGYTYNQAKCERDIGYVLDAYLKSLRYGGNEPLTKVIKYYWDGNVAQVDGDRQPEIETHNFIGNLIKNYIFTNTAYTASNTQAVQTTDLTKSVTNYSFTPSAAEYTPSTGEMVLTIGTHSLSVGDEVFIEPNSLTFTCALDNNATTHSYPRSSGVPNASGADPFYYAPVVVTAKDSTTITINVGISSDTSIHTFVGATTDAIKAGPTNKIDVLVTNTVRVITNGLGSMPTVVKSGVGTVTIIGKHDLDDILLITNTSNNEVIYSFNDTSRGGTTEIITRGVSDLFPSYLQTTDGVTELSLNYNTFTHNADDKLQVFIEKVENGKSIVTTRPYDFGTDAIERMRIAPPLSMLDADFEYGLQPTKWAAISTLRGYPSVYEVPGTDTPVLSVTTDASSGSNGIGQSLITVTTISAHGFSIGQPITIKALEDSVAGANRAEGSFVITGIPSNTSFTYYAKSKVGTTTGEVLSTTYTQLRQAGFYTGASISNAPEFTISSNGSAGTLSLELAVDAGSTILPFDMEIGASPEIGAPLTGNNIPVGAQVTAVNDNSASGGTYLTPLVNGDFNVGDTSITLVDATGVIPNLAFDSGDGSATYITSVVGNTINLSKGLTAGLTGNQATYNDTEGTNVLPVGVDAEFTISRATGTYTIDAITNIGSDYQVGDRIEVSGLDLGGNNPTNNLIIRVLSVDVTGGITGSTVDSGVAADGTGTYNGVAPTYNGGQGAGARFDVTYTNNVFTTVSLNTSTTTSSGYIANEILQIDGATLGGETITNDLLITINSVDGITGEILTFTASGTAPNATASYSNPTFTTSGVGSGIFFTVSRTGTTYSWDFLPQGGATGINFAGGDTITVTGDLLGGATPTNDLTLTINTVDGSGAILTYTVAGTAINSDTFTDQEATAREGTGAQFNVSYAADIYTVTLADGGTLYGPNQELTISGTQVGAFSPSNDIIITITSVDTSGTITGFTFTGTAPTASATYTNITGTNIEPAGTLASFNVTRLNGTYTVIALSNNGNDYSIGDRLVLSGTQLGGSSPTNDIEITVSTVSGTGGITAFTTAFDSASLGPDFDLISTILISEATTGALPRLEQITFSALATIQVSFPSAHGLVPGNTFIVTVSSDNAGGGNNHALAAGSFFVTEIPSLTALRYTARTAGAINTSAGADPIIGTIYPRPDSFFIHRPYDGGVQLGTGGPQHGAQAIRQSKKYIRYQSGKGIMYTTGALFAPSYDLRSLTADGLEVNSLITVVTDDNDHGVQVGGIIRILGVETPGYNSGPDTAVPPAFDYEVVDIVDERTFKIRAQRRLGATDAVLGFGAQMSVVSWHGATVRSGIFDDQNGIFWEYDGTNLSVNQRTGTRQLAGTIAMRVDQNLITGTNTRFIDQLKSGDRIIVKGMTHVVTHVNSQTEITVTPDWRGVVDIQGAKANLVVDKKVKQKDFNLDRLDGTGPSGYEIDISKMQMIGIQYSWYGAGFIDFMLRGADGNFTFCHRMRNSNVNTEAFMRSGNLPVRYEVTNEGPSGKLAAAMDATQTYVPLQDSSFFPDAGTLYIDNEIITFNGNNHSLNRLTGCTRAATFTNFQAGADRSYTAGPASSHNDRTGVILISQTITPLISHWGSAFLTDGGFDEDRGYIFSYTESALDVSTTKQTAFLIRLSPSVSNAIIGDLGERELLNRAQLLLQSLEITSEGGVTGGIVVEGVLNPKNYPANPADIIWSTLSSEAQGGQPSFAQIAGGGGITWSTNAVPTLTTATAMAPITVNLTASANNSGTEFEVTRTSYEANGPILLGSVLGGTTSRNGGPNIWFPGTTVQSVFLRNNNVEYRIIASQDPENGNFTNDIITATIGQDLINTNFAWFTEASFLASGATIGTAVSNGGSVTFPANTRISNVELFTQGSTNFYQVTFNNRFSGTLTAGTGTVEFEFVQPPYAQPGETVFSFIAQPGERATADFSALKELTNTPLGGRGTYPNGPDVLAINVYKVSGTNTEANIILKWGEAQA